MKKENEVDMRKLNEEKVLLGFSKKIKLHLVLQDNTWRNGFVTEMSADYFLFEDAVNGVEPIFFLDLKRVEPYSEDDRKKEEEDEM